MALLDPLASSRELIFSFLLVFGAPSHAVLERRCGRDHVSCYACSDRLKSASPDPRAPLACCSAGSGMEGLAGTVENLDFGRVLWQNYHI